MKNVFFPRTPLSRKRNNTPDYCVASFDFETDDLGGTLLFASYCVLDLDGHIIASGGYGNASEYDILNWLLEKMAHYSDGFVWYAHNAGYDWRYLVPHAHASGMQLDFMLGGGQRPIKITLTDLVNEVCIETRDSYVLFPDTLSGFAKTFAPEFPKLDHDHSKKFDAHNPDDVAYAIRDAEACAVSVFRMRCFVAEQYDCDIGLTAPGTALAAFLVTSQAAIFPPPDDAFFRACYYGGYVALLNTEATENATTYDINSSYPFAMREYGAPTGQCAKIMTHQYSASESVAQFWNVRVFVPDDIPAPVLPCRTKDGLLWPTGEFDTYCTNRELEFAKTVGCKIIALHSGYEYSELENIFTAFVDKCESLRAEYKGQTFERVIKLIQNSLYGKFGTRRERYTVDLWDGEDEDLENAIPFELLAGYIIKKSVCDDVKTAPHIAAWITANARLHLFHAIYAGGAEHVLYCDTDSITVTPEFTHASVSCGKKYGQFKLEKNWKRFRAIAPKVYAGELDDGRWTGACKGLPHKLVDYEKIYRDETAVKIEYHTLSSLSSFLKTGKNREARAATRSITSIEKVKGWKKINGKIRPKKLTG